MTIYERGNAAKQWIMSELDRLFGQASATVLDMGCGDAGKWRTFISTHPNMRIVGIDTDARAISRGKKAYEGVMNIDLRKLDAQHPLEHVSFDVVVAMSVIEHVVDRPAFLKTVWSALKPGGIAFLNYDVGHFRSPNVKERLMVPLSQLLAKAGIEGPYMKKVDDVLFSSQARAAGFRIHGFRKHNVSSLKGLMRGATDGAVESWFDFEERIAAQMSPEKLDSAMLSTTLILEKP
jgi:cyclopropane fatty-acyl-phospholipid synthase-like methyltransferase